jgi:hypothetical protein
VALGALINTAVIAYMAVLVNRELGLWWVFARIQRRLWRCGASAAGALRAEVCGGAAAPSLNVTFSCDRPNLRPTG